jgi:hypothetical protein
MLVLHVSAGMYNAVRQLQERTVSYKMPLPSQEGVREIISGS